MIPDIEDLENTIDTLNTKLAEHFYQTIQVLSSVTAYHERYYEGSHSRFVSQKSGEIARKLGLTEMEIFEVEIAGLLHDIGKVGFKDTLLVKFTTEMKSSEFRQYTQHPELGKQILSKHQGFDSIGEIIVQHHEKIDGSGFPRQLLGKEINPGAAIIAVVDTFHNSYCKRQKERTITPGSSTNTMNISNYLDMTKNRYSMSINYLTQKAGNLFDRKVVELLIEILENERKAMGQKMLIRIPISKLESGMLFAEDYYTSYGLLIASRGEAITDEIKRALFGFAESGEIPPRILVMQ